MYAFMLFVGPDRKGWFTWNSRKWRTSGNISNQNSSEILKVLCTQFHRKILLHSLSHFRILSRLRLRQHHLTNCCSVAFIWMSHFRTSSTDSNVRTTLYSIIKQHHKEVLFSGFHMNGHTLEFYFSPCVVRLQSLTTTTTSTTTTTNCQNVVTSDGNMESTFHTFLIHIWL